MTNDVTSLMQLDFTLEDIPWVKGQRLFKLWQAKRNNARWPTRKDFTIRDLAFCIEDIMFVDVIHDEEELDFRIRLAGTGFAQHLPHDPTGLYIRDLPRGDEIHTRFTHMVTLEKPYMGLNQPPMMVDDDYKRFDGIILPLGESDITVLLLLVRYHYPQIVEI